jgi:chromosome segregation ATPase
MSKIYTEDGLQDALKRMELRLEKIDSRLNDIDKTLIQNTASLEKHMLRTELAEENLKSLKQELIPVTKHVSQMSGGLKLVGILALVSGFIFSVIRIIQFL